MMQKIYLDLSPEDQESLRLNNYNLEDILESAGISADITYGVNPINRESGDKTIVPIILASAVSVVAVAYAISKILTTIQRRPRLIKIIHNIPIMTANGEIFEDKNGNPKFLEVEKYQLIEPRAENLKDGFEFSASDGSITIA